MDKEELALELLKLNIELLRKQSWFHRTFNPNCKKCRAMIEDNRKLFEMLFNKVLKGGKEKNGKQ